MAGLFGAYGAARADIGASCNSFSFEGVGWDDGYIGGNVLGGCVTGNGPKQTFRVP